MTQTINELVRDTLPDAAVMDRLMRLCIEELTASRTYQTALTLPGLARYRNVLSRCYGSHRSRAALLTDRIAAFRGNPPKVGGIWAPLLAALGPSPATLGAKAVLALLGDAEDYWQRTYREELATLDPRSRDFLHARVIPGQESTQAALHELRYATSA